MANSLLLLPGKGEQVLAYPTVQFQEGKVIAAQKNGDHFTIRTEAGEEYTGARLLFATGVTDIMPDLPGLADCWGISVLHCPYCHGYEVKGKRLGLLANGDLGFEFTRLLYQWSKNLILFTNGPSSLNAVQREKIAQYNIPIIEARLGRIMHRDGYISGVELTGSEVVGVDALFAKLAFRQHCELPAVLGCTLTEAGYLQADEMGKTDVPGVFVAGDNTSFMRSVASAVAAGNKAGAWINKDLAEASF
ncbi:NAD(P)/FAD-dependent oxidoreductase [Paraflavitalea speifideaquila]|uniref:NAD(P)/FAD-dependent oxidoreductase n=1 Tax=Paraflavitalea speifideaquila TaxID=3076558 RepID=UPI0028EB9B5F|nr:NAD(P)/FAD-dependent oxidoreductase [Paraflavitalea speifideiaquila]